MDDYRAMSQCRKGGVLFGHANDRAASEVAEFIHVSKWTVQCSVNNVLDRFRKYEAWCQNYGFKHILPEEPEISVMPC